MELLNEFLDLISKGEQRRVTYCKDRETVFAYVGRERRHII